MWHDDCPDDFEPVYYKRYVDDIFVLFQSPLHLEKFNEYLNRKHAKIKFNEKEVNESLPFSDVLISREVNESLPFSDVLISRNNKGFATTVDRKPTVSGVNFNFNTFIADECKHGLICTLVCTCTFANV